MILGMPFRYIDDTSLAKVDQISLSHLREKMTRLRQKPNGGEGDGWAEICCLAASLKQDAGYKFHAT